MNMKSVKSRNVHSFGYDPDTRTLGVRFLAKDKVSPGELAHYHDVPPNHHEEMSKEGVSVGGYVQTNFVQTKWKFTYPERKKD